MKTGNQAARIYDTAMETMEEKMTSYGEPYTRLVAKAYLPRCEKKHRFDYGNESGMKKEVSVGCAVAENFCSVCGANQVFAPCNHKQGKRYEKNGIEEVCHVVLNQATGAYEWSFDWQYLLSERRGS